MNKPDAFYSELSQISAPAIRSAIEALCKKGTEKNVSFMDLYVGCHVKWHIKDDKKIIALLLECQRLIIQTVLVYGRKQKMERIF